MHKKIMVTDELTDNILHVSLCNMFLVGQGFWVLSEPTAVGGQTGADVKRQVPLSPPSRGGSTPQDRSGHRTSGPASKASREPLLSLRLLNLCKYSMLHTHYLCIRPHGQSCSMLIAPPEFS